MGRHCIAVIGGDGIGPEVVAEGLKCLRALSAVEEELEFEFREFPFNCQYYLEHGRMMPPDGLEQLGACEAIYLGGIGSPGEVPDEISLRETVLAIRFHFQQYANVRPCRPLAGAAFPLTTCRPEEIDFVVVREATEGLYAGIGGRYHPGDAKFDELAARVPAVRSSREVAVQAGVYTETGIRRVCRYAFELARRRKGRKLVTNCTKTNAMNYGMVFWDEIFTEVAEDYPDIEHERRYVDALAMQMVLNPTRYDVIVAPNLFGDIITDITAALQGGLGMAPGANIAPGGISMFEPPHGTAPDIAGHGTANPLAAILTAELMLRELGEASAAERLHDAVAKVVEARQVRTPDLGGSASCGEVGDAVVAALGGLV